MRAKIIRIGNSKGIRLPKPILEASGITDEADVTVEDGRIVLLRPPKHPREGWAEAIEAIGVDEEDWSEIGTTLPARRWKRIGRGRRTSSGRTSPSFRRISHRPRSRPRLRNRQSPALRDRLIG
jgi:antitoxin MazE